MAGLRKRKDAPTAAPASTKKTKKTVEAKPTAKPAAPAPAPVADKKKATPRKRAADYYSDSEAEEAAGWEGFEDDKKKKGTKAAVKKDSKPAPKKTKKADKEEEKKKDEEPVQKTDAELEKAGELITVEDVDDEEDHAEAYLKGFESSDDESDDDKEAPEEKGRGDMSNAGIPHAKKTQKKLRAVQKSDKRGIIILERVPHGFYEQEMKSYFSQFGEVTRLRLSRNKKTGRSKHYAFLEFANDSVAEIVADTMNNYLLFGHILKCRVMKDLTPEQIERLFKGANKRFKVIPRAKLAKRDNDKPKTEEQWNKLVVREDERREKKKQQLKDLGIDYDFQIAKPVEASEAEPVAEETPAPKAIKAAEEEPSKEDAAAADAITQAIKGDKKGKAKKEKVAPVKARKSKRVAAQSK